MNALFKHFLITRYNVPLEGWELDKSGIYTRDDAWMEHRFQLFKKYCVPTILAQSEDDFTWLIYCDRNTSQVYLDNMNSLIKSIPNAMIRLTGGYHECLSDIDGLLSKAETPFVITSRLDNDDGLGIHYIRIIQQNFIAQNGVILNLLNGHGYNVIRHVTTEMYNIRNNHFSSLIERNNSAGGHISIRGFQHDNPPADFVIRNLPEKNAWLKIFHERNLKSSPFGYPVFRHKFFEWYGLNSSNTSVSVPNTILYSLWWLAVGLFRKLKKYRRT